MSIIPMRKIGSILLGVVVLVVVVLGVVPYHLPVSDSIILADKYGEILIGERSDGYDYVQELPVALVEKIIAIEDPRFRSHPGVDIWALGRAVLVNIRYHSWVEGASTIDQQLIKLTYEVYQRSFRAKLFEIATALRLNLHASKDAILVAYVNALPFPYAHVGLRAGCNLYFATSCDKLSDSQQYFLIASYQLGANGFSTQGFDQIKQRSQSLCERVSSECASLSQQSPIGIADLADREFGIPLHLVDWYSHELSRGYSPPEHLQHPNQPMRLPVDFDLYQRIQGIIQTTAGQRMTVSADDCCVLVLDQQGAVITMNMCRPWDDLESGQINSCLSKRQTGSTIKPFLYIRAMSVLGLQATDTIVDEQVTYSLNGGAVYTPQNFDLSYHGEVSLATALGSSLNIPAVKVLDQAGAERFVPFLSLLRETVGEDVDSIRQDAEQFSLDRQGLSLALGTYEMSPYEFALLWRVFLDELLPDQYRQGIVEVSTILVEPRWRVLSFGQDNVLNLPGRVVKTGTSRHFVDGWTCGAHPMIDRIVCVWMGNHDATPMRASGIETAGYLWRLVAEEVAR